MFSALDLQRGYRKRTTLNVEGQGFGKIETSDHIWELIEYVRALPKTA
jgi:hypothetical protein